MRNGKIVGAHCDCMAGLGESCSHVASLLWVIGVGVEKRDSLTVTQKSAYWVMPPPVRSVPYLPIKEINFIGKKRKSLALATCIAGNKPQHSSPSNSGGSSKCRKIIDVPSVEKKDFLDG